MDIRIYPFDGGEILRRKKSLKRQLSERDGLLEKRVAVLSGSTVGDVKDVLEIFLLHFGIKPQFYVGQFNRFYEEILFENRALADFKPDLIYIHTTTRNLSDPALMDKLQAMWAKIEADYACAVVQNNFELPAPDMAIDAQQTGALNLRLADYARAHSDFHVNDIQRLSAAFGLNDWFDPQDYFLYKYAMSVRAIPALCHHLAVIVKTMYGKNQKCLVLDLDNTLWGGVVGDQGVMGIELGMETAAGEAYVAFQRYVKRLHERGIILAVCSKNEERVAREAFSNPNMVLRLEDIAVFCANWESKAENLRRIAAQLNILPESMVFVDDNPAERTLVSQMLPEVRVVDENSVTAFARHIEEAGYFYNAGVSEDDKKRNDYYAADAVRNATKSAYADYGNYLRSLEMTCAIHPFEAAHFERITQLINKTNQFNLTTRRYSRSEVEKIASDPSYVARYATLDDKFGGNGIVSVLIGEIAEEALHIRLWVMSCRVFKRDLELAIFDRLVELCRSQNLTRIVGYYFKTEKNGYVENLLSDLSFNRTGEDSWTFDLTTDYRRKNQYIEWKEGTDE